MNLPDSVKKMPEDFSEDLKNKVSEYIEIGLPELSKYVSDQNKIKKMISGYLNGSSADELSISLSWPVEVVGYLIYKHGLYDLKQKMINSMSLTIAEKIKILKLKHFDFMFKAADKIMEHYLNSMNGPKSKPIDEIDTEWLKIYMKIVDNLLATNDPESVSKQLLDIKNNIHTSMPHITLQLPTNSKIQKEVDGSVVISSEMEAQKQNAIKEILKTLVEIKKQEKGN